MEEALKQIIIKTLENFQNRIGETIAIDDWICTSGRSYDRHQTRYNRIVLELDEFMVRTSGAIATMGNENQSLEFSTGAIKNIEIVEGATIIEIQMTDTVWRRLKFN